MQVAEASQTELRSLLNQEYLLRCRRNSHYSLRSYARDLSIDPTLLSRLMKGERNISSKMQKRLCDELDLTLEKSIKILKTPKFRQSRITDNEFSLISKWYFFAILDLFLLKDFEPSPKIISARLGLSVTEVKAAINVLIDLGYLEAKNGSISVVTQATRWSKTKNTSRERMNFQKQLLALSIQAVDKVEFTKRENASLTLATNSKLLPEIKNRIQNFKDELGQFIESQGQYDQVYQLVIGFFPLTK